MGNPTTPSTRPFALRQLPWLLALLTLLACKPPPAEPPASLPGAASEPAAAVRALAQRLHDNDLAGFARTAVPAADYARLDSAWREGRSRWPLIELPLDEQLLPLLQTLSAPGAEARLKQGFDRQLAHQDRDLRDAARNLGLFGVRYVQEDAGLDEAQRKHAAAVIEALSDWGQRAPLGDPKRARAAIDRLCAAARRTGIRDDASLSATGMEQSLQKLGPFLAELKAVLAEHYGLALDDALAQLQSGLQEQHGDHATVQVRYPLARAQIETVATLERREGHWYLASQLRQAEALAAVTKAP
ncbi:MAG: hypothetical protein QM599_04985 [Pseudoxanthomonas sp.]